MNSCLIPRYRIFRKKTYIMYVQAPISEADSNALAARNCEARGVDEVKQEAAHEEAPKVREDKAR